MQTRQISEEDGQQSCPSPPPPQQHIDLPHFQPLTYEMIVPLKLPSTPPHKHGSLKHKTKYPAPLHKKKIYACNFMLQNCSYEINCHFNFCLRIISSMTKSHTKSD